MRCNANSVKAMPNPRALVVETAVNALKVRRTLRSIRHWLSG